MAVPEFAGWRLGVLHCPSDEDLKLDAMDSDQDVHIGYISEFFRTKKEAAAFYDAAFCPRMRPLNAHKTWTSDCDPSTGLKFYVTPNIGQKALLDSRLLWAEPVPDGPLPEKYGSPNFVRIDDVEVAMALAVESYRFAGGPNHNVISAWKTGRLYGLQVYVTQELLNSGERGRSIFLHSPETGCNVGFWHLPCYLMYGIEDKTRISMIWVAPRARRKGLGRRMVQMSGALYADCVLKSIRGFWDKLGIAYDKTSN